ncbi:winged helix-turn-helix transcriptional regulator [Smaragdicoccus niigatensis]|uniref:winged helix-turn-helix transcriptional regulator n=1 Tax=Smaragdicoccus niigatensis TaxID=359359 RepID=UPI0003653B98|nr:winged helix-turn-helix transcriptional regulator [Smaragdicoccus niigatensis]
MSDEMSVLAGEDSVFGTVTVIGDAWSWLVLREAIFSGVTRFEDFRSRLGVARSTLAARLEHLVAGDVLRRGPGGAYLLSDRGADFFGCLILALTWGDRWFADDAGIPHVVTHIGCGERMSAEVRCSHCHDRVEAQAVRFESRPRPGRADSRRHRTPDLALLERERPSSVARTLQVLGEHWSALILREAFFGVRRFDDFQRGLSIATNILAQRLDRLVELGVLDRVPYQEQPLRHEYRLTRKGIDLYPVPLAMMTWGDRWLADGNPPVPLTHLPCGERFTSVLACGHCGEPISRTSVRFA